MSEKVYGAGALEATYQNLLLNPSFETVLFGTHTAAIKTNGIASTNLRNQFPGWQSCTPAGTAPVPSMTVDVETSIFQTPGKQSAKVSSVTLGDSTNAVFLEQRWNATHFLDNFAAMCAGLIVTAACDIKLVNPVASAFRIGISVDGGSNYTYSPYKANDTNWERLIVSLAGGSAPTDVRFRLSFEKGSTIEYYVDNIMVVAAPVALDTLPFVPRPPVMLRTNKVSLGGAVSFAGGGSASSATPTDCDSASFLSTQWALNSERPHWANKFAGRGYCQNSAAGEAYVTMEAKGGTATDGIYGGYTTASTYAYWWGECEIGQDGLIKVSISPNSNGYGGFYNKEWIGVGL